MNQFSDRIQILIDRFGRKNLSEKTGISTTQLHRLRGGSDTSRENLVRIRDATSCCLEWLATGNGPAFKTDTYAINEPSERYSFDINNLDFSNDELELIRLFRSAGLAAKSRVLNELIK